MRLTDYDIGDVLACINSLKLVGCVIITGQRLDLEPLRGSIVLEQLDLSMAKQHEDPLIDPGPFISEGVVVPIVESIVPEERTFHTQLQLP